MWNFVFGCFILGAAFVGLLHGELGSLVAIAVVLLWFSGLFRPARTIWLSFLQVGALAGSIVYGYDAFVGELSTPALAVTGIVLGILVLVSALLWVRAIREARREEERTAPVVTAPLPRRRETTSLWVEVVAWIVLIGIPFGLGAWAAEASFDDQEQETSAP